MNGETKKFDILEDEKFIRGVLSSHSNVNGYATFQKQSFENFMENFLPQIIAEHQVLTYDSKSLGQRHIIKFGDITVCKPNNREADGKVSPLLPDEARYRQLDYCNPVMLDTTHEVWALNGDEVGELLERHLYREVPFAEIPCMVQTKYCHLCGKSRLPTMYDGSDRPQQECPYDEGGYFLVRGLEKTVQVQEGLRTNFPVIFSFNQPYKYIFVCEVRSRHESKLRSSSTLQVFVTSKKGGSCPDIFVALPFLTSMDLQVMMIIRLLGFTDKQMLMRLIVGNDELVAPYISAILEHPSNLMQIDELYEYIGKQGTKETTVDARRRYVTHLLANELLPHLGFQNTPLINLKKVMYLSVMIRRLIRAYLNTPSGFNGNEIDAQKIVEVDDRDHYANKRLSLCGTLMALLFRQLMRQFVNNLRRYLYMTIENKRYLNIADAVNNRKITAALRYAFRTGNWTTQRSSGTHVGVTQMIIRTSHAALQSQIRRVNTPICREGKATHLRQAHASQWGILCPRYCNFLS